MGTPKQTTFTGLLSTLETEIGKVMASPRVPVLPDNLKELIVKFAPYLAMLSMLMLVPLILAAFGLSTLFLPFSYLGGLHFGFGYTIGLVFTFGMIILELMAIPGLFKRQLQGWRLVFYSTLLTLVEQLLRFDLVGAVIGGAISFYFLFQVKSKYK